METRGWPRQNSVSYSSIIILSEQYIIISGYKNENSCNHENEF